MAKTFSIPQEGHGGYTWEARTVDLGDEYPLEKGLDGVVNFIVSRTPSSAGDFGWFTLAPLPGCCGVVVSIHSRLKEGWAGTPVIGDHFHKLKEHVARELGYSMMLATTQLRNIPEVVGASKAGWRIEKFFRNKRSGNDIGVMFKELK
jgi:hypothetical protein